MSHKLLVTIQVPSKSISSHPIFPSFFLSLTWNSYGSRQSVIIHRVIVYIMNYC